VTQGPPPSPGITFVPGDEIRIRVSFTHSGNPVAVDAIYAQEGDESRTITLSGNPELEEGSPAYGEDKHSEVVLSAVVDVAHKSGDYRVARVVFYQFSGTAFEFTAPGMLPSVSMGMWGRSGQLTTATDAASQQESGWPIIRIMPEPPGGEITDVRLADEEP